jgi:hypothetical protein
MLAVSIRVSIYLQMPPGAVPLSGLSRVCVHPSVRLCLHPFFISLQVAEAITFQAELRNVHFEGSLHTARYRLRDLSQAVAFSRQLPFCPSGQQVHPQAQALLKAPQLFQKDGSPVRRDRDYQAPEVRLVGLLSCAGLCFSARPRPASFAPACFAVLGLLSCAGLCWLRWACFG